jgi:hypothetical protein
MNNITLTSEQARVIIAKHGKITYSAIRDLLNLPKEKKKIKVQKAKNNNLNEIKLLLRLSGIEYSEEHRFSDRKYRFDIILLPIELKIAIEYEGIFSEKSRHTNVNGYSKDCEKYNLASSLGWKVLRYTALNFTNVIADVKLLIDK